MFDAQGELLEAMANVIYVIASPAAAPRIVRTMSFTDIYSLAGITIDGTTNELYLLSTDIPGSHVDALHRTSSGTWVRDRTITFASSAGYFWPLDAGAHHLFLRDSTHNSVDELSSDLAGSQNPIVRIPYFGPWDIKLAL